MANSEESAVGQDAKEVFMICMEAKDESHREEILGGVSPEVAKEVRELLLVQSKGDLVDRAFEIDETHDVPPLESLGKRIGNYKLLEQIGEGGMGTVFMAQQIEPVRRKVALKLIKAGMDSRQVVARFEAERQALALMDHSNIARVLDGGTTEDGLPYFVMELVRGIPLTDFAERQKSSTQARLKLFLDLCAGIQHAHQRGIIHRDLKPSNVMVTLHDDQPVVKVIDFGIAKAMNQELTDKTLFTQFASMVGTPLYMSPEQAELSGLDVDMRSDVYSLGVLLYELLTGTPPFDRATLKNKGFDEIRRMIRETTPPRPSQRISTIHISGMDTNESGIPIRELQRRKSELVGELDWIVMKALEKQRQRRYQSAAELAADVQRFLDGRVVLARPPKWTYLASKWISNHRLIASSLLAIACVILVAFCLVVQQRGEAIAQAQRANEMANAEAEQRGELQTSLDRERQLRDELREANELNAQRLYRNQIRLATYEWDSGNPWLGKETLLGTEADRRGWEYFYLLGLMNQDRIASFEAHTKANRFVSFLPGLDCVVSAQSDRVYFWNQSTGETIGEIEFNERLVNLAVDPNGDEIAILTRTGKLDSSIAIHEVPTGRLLRQRIIESFRGMEIEYDSSGDLIAACNGSENQRGIAFLDASDLSLYAAEIPHWGASHLIFSPKAPTRVIGVDNDGAAVEVGIPNPSDTEYVDPEEMELTKLQEMILDLEDRIHQVSWDDNVELLATSQMTNSFAKVWRLNPVEENYAKSKLMGLFTADDNAEIVHSLQHPSQVWGLVFNEGGRQLITGCGDTIIRVWDLETGEVIKQLRGHDAPVRRLAVHPNGRWLVSADQDHRCVVWDMRSKPQPEVSPQATDEITSMAISPDGLSLFVGTLRGLCGVWDLASGNWTRWKSVHVGGVWDIQFGTDPTKFVTCGLQDKKIRYWDIEGDAPLAEFDSTRAQSASILPSGTEIAVGIDTYSLTDLKQTHTDELSAIAMDTAISADGKLLAMVALGSRFRVYERETNRVLLDLPAPGGLRGTVSISPNGQWASCTGRRTREITLSNLKDGSTIELKGHLTSVTAAAFLDDERLVSASEGGTLRIWDVNSPRSILSLSADGSSIKHLVVSKDGNSIFAACDDKTIKTWSIERK